MADENSPEYLLEMGMKAEEAGSVFEAEGWYQRAAVAGNSLAFHKLGVLADKAGDVTAAKGWWERSAQDGNSQSMCNLGNVARREGDTATAKTWWLKAAQADHAVAMLNLGILANEDDDAAEAESWWTKAAEANDVRAMYNLGLLFQNNDNLAAATAWWLRASELDYPPAMNSLGLLKFNAGDLITAEKWWTKAATAGHELAQANLKLIPEARGPVHVVVEPEPNNNSVSNSEMMLTDDAANLEDDLINEFGEWIANYKPLRIVDFDSHDSAEVIEAIDSRLVWVVYNDGDQFLVPLESWNDAFGEPATKHVNDNRCWILGYFVCEVPVESEDLRNYRLTVWSRGYRCSECSSEESKGADCKYCLGNEYFELSVWLPDNRESLKEVCSDLGISLPSFIPSTESPTKLFAGVDK